MLKIKMEYAKIDKNRVICRNMHNWGAAEERAKKEEKSKKRNKEIISRHSTELYFCIRHIFAQAMKYSRRTDATVIKNLIERPNLRENVKKQIVYRQVSDSMAIFNKNYDDTYGV